MGSISAAARTLHLSQSTVSEAIQSLERQLAQTLFVRGRNGVIPTPAGRRLEDAARTILSTHDRLLQELQETAASPHPVRLGVPLEFPAIHLTQVLAQLAESRPDVAVELVHSSSAAQWEALRRGRLDVALVRDKPTDPDYDAALAVEEAMGVILAENVDVELRGDAVPLTALAGLRWIAFARSDAPAWWDQVSATLRANGIAAGMSEDDRPVPPEVKLAAVASGRTFAFGSPTWAHPLPPGMAWRPLAGDPIVRRTWAVWRAETTRLDVAALVAALAIRT
ncbi:LysR family transcriptional regulator [Microbispora bryophytorum]|uniref:LysR substrate-binding domain-containing protein n=1 Tax=Microbispora bryophytorum TaxID=1460882 RepID=UPI0033DC46E9